MHFARPAFKFQRVGFIAVFQHHRVGAHLAHHAFHALGLFRAQVEGKTQAVLGDHQADFAGFFVRFVSGVDQADAVAGVKLAGQVVIHIGQVAERGFRVGGGRLYRGFARRARPLRHAQRLQLGDGVAAQGVQQRGRGKPGLAQAQGDVAGDKHAVAQLGQLFAQAGQRALAVAGRLQRQRRMAGDAQAVFVGQRQRQAVGVVAEGQPHAHPAIGGFFAQRLFPGVVAVAVHLHAGLELGQHGRVVGGDFPALAVGVGAQVLHGVGLHADDVAFFHEVQAVAIAQRILAHQLKAVGVHPADHAQRQADEFGRIKGANIAFAAGGKVIGAAAMKGFVRVGGKADMAFAAGGARQLGAAGQNLVQQQAVMGGDVLHIVHVLVAAFDLERAHASVDQRFQIVALVIVLHRQQMLVVGHHPALFVGQRVRQATGLRAVAAIGAAPGFGVADIALPGKRHAQRAVDEIFNGGGVAHPRGHLADVRQRQFARQHQLRQASVGQKTRFVGAADIALGGGVQLNGRDVQLHDAHVLNNQRVHASIVKLVNQLPRRLQLVVVQNGVEGDKNPRVVAVGKFHQLGNLAD